MDEPNRFRRGRWFVVSWGNDDDVDYYANNGNEQEQERYHHVHQPNG